jgi:hypothetical protein
MLSTSVGSGSGAHLSDSTGASVSPVSTFSSGHMPGLDHSPELGPNSMPLFDAMPSGYSTDLPSPELLLHLCVTFHSYATHSNSCSTAYRCSSNVKSSPTPFFTARPSFLDSNFLRRILNTRPPRFSTPYAPTHRSTVRKVQMRQVAIADTAQCTQGCAWPKRWKMRAWEDDCSRPYRVRLRRDPCENGLY